MAHSRTERIGTIFTRVSSLLKGGATKEANLPLWYEVYKAFPPKYEPMFNRPVWQKQVQNIFYKEDEIRAKFQTDVSLSPINLASEKVTQTQIFLTIYKSLLQTGTKEEEAYSKALENYKVVFDKSKLHNRKPPSSSSQAQLNNLSKQTKPQ